MKWFLTACALAGVAAVLSSFSCGPQRDFCPTKPPEYSCLNYDGGSGGQGGQDQGPCDGASQVAWNE